MRVRLIHAVEVVIDTISELVVLVVMTSMRSWVPAVRVAVSASLVDV
jgi:hypothetical protein